MLSFNHISLWISSLLPLLLTLSCPSAGTTVPNSYNTSTVILLISSPYLPTYLHQRNSYIVSLQPLLKSHRQQLMQASSSRAQSEARWPISTSQTCRWRSSTALYPYARSHLYAHYPPPPKHSRPLSQCLCNTTPSALLRRKRWGQSISPLSFKSSKTSLPVYSKTLETA